MIEKVWIVFRVPTFMTPFFQANTLNLPRTLPFGRIEAITHTREVAEKFAHNLAERIDPMFGLDIIEYEIDVEKAVGNVR